MRRPGCRVSLVLSQTMTTMLWTKWVDSTAAAPSCSLTHVDVRPDSMAVLRAAREVVEEPDFQEVLDSVRKRVDDIESLHRTRELRVCVVLVAAGCGCD